MCNLGTGVDYKLSVNQQCEMAAKKASVILGHINKWIDSKSNPEK